MVKYFLSFVVFLTVLNLQAQESHKDILFTVADEPVDATEFVRIFNKNLDLVKDETQKDVDEYLKLFINYKLKLKEAKAKGLDQKPSYIRELDNYKKQLAKNYLTDTEVTDELVEEAYERVTNEVKASHILIRMNEGAQPEDTLLAYNELLKLRDRVINEGFENVKDDVHNGQTVFAEDLGYFGGFKMVYAFESMAFNTPVGTVSMPFKTQFGYHIVIVDDKRPSRGERTVGHIMISHKTGEGQDDAETRINDIYKKIQQGEDFESLAKQFSEDKSSAKNGGKLAPFTGGQLSSTEFEEAAFSIENINDVTPPIETTFGWHIIKLYDKKGIESYDVMKSELEAKVKRDSRSQLINTSIVNTLKERYQVADNQEALAYFESILSDDYFTGKWMLPAGFEGDKTFFTLGDKPYSYQMFGDFLSKSQRKATPKKALKKLVSENYDVFLSNSLMEYQEGNLENESEDFAHIVNEYRDGLLLFDLMETEIWNTSKTDSLGLQKYYEENKNTYFWNERVDADVASSSDKNIIKKVEKMFQSGQDPEAIKTALNTNDEVHVIFTSGILDAEHQSLPASFEFKEGISDIYKHNGGFIVASVKSVLPKAPKSFEDCKGQIISDYQAYKEENWLKELAIKYPVTINEEVLQNVKTQIKNQ